MYEKRLVAIIVSFFIFAFVLQINIVEIICLDYGQAAIKQTNKTIQISTGRANIVDASFNAITGTKTQYNALVETQDANLQKIFNSLSDENKIKFNNQIQDYKRVVVEVETPIEQEILYITKQRYTSNNIAQHIIGYTNIDNVGVSGIEKAFDEKLNDNGEILELNLKVNGNGDVYGDIIQNISEREEVLSLTIDNSIQRLAESIAKEYITNGSIVIMETRTGKIRAIASTPIYDANNVEDYLESENSPLLNKAFLAYEPGSVVKPLWAALALENGYSMHSVYECKGQTEINGHIYGCANGTAHGIVDMQEALRVSCNGYFINLYYQQRPHWMAQMANQMNFTNSIELAENYKTNNAYFPQYEDLLDLGKISSVSFGQGEFLTTPIHITAYMNIFANDGVYVLPKISQGIYDDVNYDLIENLYEYEAKRVISQENAQLIKEMLTTVVDEGAQARAKPEYLTAAGKTGTAQTGIVKEDGEELFNAWFSGFYPADNPQYTITVHLYDGGESSYSATKIFKQICDQLYFLMYPNVDIGQEILISEELNY